MKKYTGWIWGAVALAILVMWWPFKLPSQLSFDLFNDSEVIVEDNQHVVDSLKGVIDLYIEDNKELNLKINDLNSQIGDLQNDVERRENTINKLKRETNEKANSVTKFNTTDIYKFLSDRYKDSTTVK